MTTRAALDYLWLYEGATDQFQLKDAILLAEEWQAAAEKSPLVGTMRKLGRRRSERMLVFVHKYRREEWLPIVRALPTVREWPGTHNLTISHLWYAPSWDRLAAATKRAPAPSEGEGSTA